MAPIIDQLLYSYLPSELSHQNMFRVATEEQKLKCCNLLQKLILVVTVVGLQHQYKAMGSAMTGNTGGDCKLQLLNHRVVQRLGCNQCNVCLTYHNHSSAAVRATFMSNFHIAPIESNQGEIKAGTTGRGKRGNKGTTLKRCSLICLCLRYTAQSHCSLL